MVRITNKGTVVGLFVEVDKEEPKVNTEDKTVIEKAEPIVEKRKPGRPKKNI